MKVRRYALGLLLVALPLWADEAAPEKPAEAPGPGDIAIPDPGTPIEDAAVAKQEVARFGEAMKAAGDEAEKAAVLERLGRWDHSEVLRAAARHLRARSEPLAVAAVVVCARQRTSRGKAGAVLAKALRREKRTAVYCALLVGLGRLGYDKTSIVRTAEKVFRRDTSETHKAAARYFGYIRSKEAFRMLAEKLDEPSFDLPPKDRKQLPIPSEAEKRRKWEEWKSAYPWIQWALSQLVPGETFETTEEARLWALSQGHEHGISW